MKQTHHTAALHRWFPSVQLGASLRIWLICHHKTGSAKVYSIVQLESIETGLSSIPNGNNNDFFCQFIHCTSCKTKHVVAQRVVQSSVHCTLSISCCSNKKWIVSWHFTSVQLIQLLGAFPFASQCAIWEHFVEKVNDDSLIKWDE